MNKGNLYILSLIGFFFGVLMVQNPSFSQSKKEQIKVLESQIDEVYIKISNERQVQITLIKELENKEAQRNRTIDSLEKVIQEIEKQMVSEKKETEQLNKTTKKITSQVQQGRDSLKVLTRVINTQNNNRVLMIDSNDFIENENNYDFYVDKNPTSNPNQNALSGVFKSYWPSNWNESYANGKKQIYATGRYKDGIKDGPWKYFLCDGKIQYEGNYKNGLREGQWMNYDFCHRTFDFNDLPDDGYGYFDVFLTIKDYYSLDYLEFSKEEIFFSEGKPLDTLYYRNQKNKLILKFNIKTKEAFYDNNQRLSNQKLNFNYPLIINSENRPLEMYHRNGTKAYHMWINGVEINEYFYNSKGVITQKCKYVNENGNCQTFGADGKPDGTSEECFGCGKWGWECPCQ